MGTDPSSFARDLPITDGAVKSGFGDGFERYREAGAGARLYGKLLADCDKEELLAVIGYLGESKRRQDDMRRQQDKFMQEFRV